MCYGVGMTKRKFYKTTYKTVILSEEPIPESMDLRDALAEATDGSYSGDVVSQSTVVINGKQAARALLKQRSSPSFFQLTNTGEDAQ